MKTRFTPLILTLGIYLATAPAGAWARGAGGSRGGGAAGGQSSAAGAGTGAGAGSSIGTGGSRGGAGRGGGRGHGYGGRGYGARYGRPGTFTGYGDPYGQHRDYALSQMNSRTSLTGDQIRVVDLQRVLKARGYYRGPMDGRFGPGSVEALEQFRRARGLTPGGSLDRATLDALRSGAV